jgi:hypothetical protein
MPLMAELESSTMPPASGGSDGAGLTPGEALRWAWVWWIVLLLAPFVVFLGVVVTMLSTQGTPRPAVANAFFMIALLWLAVTVPLAFALRSYCFRAYWEGQPVEPHSYLRGMVTVWLAMEIGGLISLVGCWVSYTLMPCLLPAAVAFMLFTPFWPSGNAMEESATNLDDEQLYHEPS